MAVDHEVGDRPAARRLDQRGEKFLAGGRDAQARPTSGAVASTMRRARQRVRLVKLASSWRRAAHDRGDRARAWLARARGGVAVALRGGAVHGHQQVDGASELAGADADAWSVPSNSVSSLAATVGESGLLRLSSNSVGPAANAAAGMPAGPSVSARADSGTITAHRSEAASTARKETSGPIRPSPRAQPQRKS